MAKFTEMLKAMYFHGELNNHSIMGMYMTLHTVADADIQAVADEPLKLEILHDGDFLDPAVLDGLDPEERQEILDWKPQIESQRFHVEGNFQSLHYLLTGESEWNSGSFPLNFLITQRLGIGEIGWGKANFYNASEVRQIADALNTLDRIEVEKRFSPEVFVERNIYPQGYKWKTADGTSLIKALGQLHDFVMRTADKSHGFYITME